MDCETDGFHMLLVLETSEAQKGLLNKPHYTSIWYFFRPVQSERHFIPRFSESEDKRTWPKSKKEMFPCWQKKSELLVIIRVLLTGVLFSKKTHGFGHLVFPNDISFLFSKNGNTLPRKPLSGLLSGFCHLSGVLWDKGKYGASLGEGVYALCST